MLLWNSFRCCKSVWSPVHSLSWHLDSLDSTILQKCTSHARDINSIAMQEQPITMQSPLYQAFVLPHLGYCSVVWNSCGATLAKRIERVQNYALRMILQKPPLTSSESLRQTLGWTTLEMRRRNALLCQVHRCFTNQAPSYLCSKFAPNSSLHYPDTWGSTKLHLPHPRTKFYHSSFEFQGAKIFNSLPRSIRELKDRKQFRHAVQIYSL